MSDNQATMEPPASESVKADDEVVVVQQPPKGSRRKQQLISALPPLFTLVASSLITAVVFRVWRAHFGVPFQYGADSLPHGMHLQQMAQHGWYWRETRLGAPFSQHFQDWPLPDITSLVTGWILTLFTSNWAAIANGMYLLSFPLVAISGWWAARKLGVSPWMATVVGILYSFLPYHHIRGETHLFLSNYYVVPIAIVLAARTVAGEPLFRSNFRYRSKWLRFLSWQTVQTILLCAIAGLGGVYYAAFALLFVGTAVVIRFLHTRRWRALVPGVMVAAFVAFFTISASSPTILYHQDHGPNVDAVDRQHSDSDVYGLKLAQMLAPSPGHHIDTLNNFQNRYLNEYPLPGERGSASLGTIGSIGLLYLFFIAILTLASPAKLTGSRERRGHLALFALVGFLFATIGGISTLVSMLLSSDIRSWNRMSIFIGFFALTAIALLVDAGLKRLSRRNFSILMPIAVVGMIVVGTLDQTNNEWIPDYKNVDAAYLSDQTFFHGVENSLPAGSEVFELPEMSFPEAAPFANIQSYDLLKPYLHTSKIKWSFGGVKGRVESQWQDRLADVPFAELPKYIYAAGFEGIYIDRNGFDDNASAMEAAFQSTLGEQPKVDSFGKKAFYDLRAYGATLPQPEVNTLHDDLLYPVAIVGGEKFFGTETNGESHWKWADGNRGELVAENATKTSKLSRVTFNVKTTTDQPYDFTITWPDNSVTHVNATSAGADVTKDITLKPGDSHIKISTNAPRLTGASDPRNLVFRVAEADVSPVS